MKAKKENISETIAEKEYRKLIEKLKKEVKEKQEKQRDEYLTK